MSEPKLKETLGSITNVADFDDPDICPPWWPQLLWRLHFPFPHSGGGGIGPGGPVNYPPAINNIMANLHIHTMSYLMKDQSAAQAIRNSTEEQIATAARSLSKDHDKSLGSKVA